MGPTPSFRKMMGTNSPPFPRMCVNSWELPLLVAKKASDLHLSVVLCKYFSASNQRIEQSVAVKSGILL